MRMDKENLWEVFPNWKTGNPYAELFWLSSVVSIQLERFVEVIADTFDSAGKSFEIITVSINL